MSSSLSYLPYLAMQLPVVVVWIVGIVISIWFWRRHPAVSLMTIAALVLQLMGMGMGIAFMISFNRAAMGMSSPQMALIMQSRAAVQAGISVLSYALLLTAVFTARKERKPAEP